ncbi:hypothetical protein [Anaerococcus sp. AGMB09787]|uniref:hypothetical protein n=1 Tax=Anaerococcus sp. AGMB09787 TaxID=2922869 RepID=UPI001FB025BE|nr:hypothetical protein [Anaerococcus sp. AGMB09787]
MVILNNREIFNKLIEEGYKKEDDKIPQGLPVAKYAKGSDSFYISHGKLHLDDKTSELVKSFGISYEEFGPKDSQALKDLKRKILDNL